MCCGPLLGRALAVGAGEGGSDITLLRVMCISCSPNLMHESILKLAVYASNSVSHNGCTCVVIIDVLAVCHTDWFGRACIHVVNEFVHPVRHPVAWIWLADLKQHWHKVLTVA